MKNNQSILKKIENLLKPESTILADLHKKIDDNTSTVAKKEKSISDKKQKIANIETEINGLNEENAVLLEAFNALKDKDLKLITNVLKLNLDVNKDLNKLVNQLPLQIEIRNNDISDLQQAISEDEKKLDIAHSNITDLESKLNTALENQKNLNALIKDASGGSCTETRNEVIELLKNLEFNNDEAYAAAKLIMFPEDELMPFFKNFKFEITQQLDDNETYVDLDNIVDALKEVNLDDDKTLENKKEVSIEPTDDFLSSFDTNIFDFDSLNNPASTKTLEDNTESSSLENKKENKDTSNVDNEKPSELSSEVKLEDESLKEESKDNETKDNEESASDDYQKLLEDETPISFEELKNLFEENTEDKNTSTKEVNAKNAEDSANNDIISLDELQDKMNDIFKDLNEEESSSNKEDSTESNSLENTEVEDIHEATGEELKDTEEEPVNFDEQVLINLEKSAEDIALIKPFDTSKLDSKEIKSELIKKDIKPKTIPLVVYKNGLQNYLANIDTLKEFGYKPNEMEIEKNGVVLSLISNEDLNKNLKTLKDYKIDLKSTNGHLAFNVLGVEPKELIRRIDLIIENNQSDLITYDIAALALDVETILKRIAFCKEYNIPYTEEKNNILTFNSYVFNQDVLEELVEKEVNFDKDDEVLTDNLKKVVASNVIDILDNKLDDIFNIKLQDAKKFDEYTRLEQKLESICVCKGNAYIIDGLYFSHQNTKRNLITLINNENDISDQDILIASLLYNSTKTIDDVKNIIESIRG